MQAEDHLSLSNTEAGDSISCGCRIAPSEIFCNPSHDPFLTSQTPFSCERTLKRTNSELECDEALLQDFALISPYSLDSVQKRRKSSLLDIAMMRPYERERELKRASLIERMKQGPARLFSDALLAEHENCKVCAQTELNPQALYDNSMSSLDSPFESLRPWLPSFYDVLPQEGDPISSIEAQDSLTSGLPYTLKCFSIGDMATHVLSKLKHGDNAQELAVPLPSLSEDEKGIFTPSANIDAQYDSWRPDINLEQLCHEIVIASAPGAHIQSSKKGPQIMVSTTSDPRIRSLQHLPTVMEKLPYAKFGEKPKNAHLAY